jgi:hypothetical protein
VATGTPCGREARCDGRRHRRRSPGRRTGQARHANSARHHPRLASRP